MNADFPRILTLLRKERGISQKQAAKELNLSQALLSHYEKGIRECGLDFVVRTAEFYHVSCDYLLGLSPERTGATLSLYDISEAEERKDCIQSKSLASLNKKLVSNSLHITFDILEKINRDDLTSEISNYFMLAVYQMFRMLYGINVKNEVGLFTVPQNIFFSLSFSEMLKAQASVKAMLENYPNKKEYKINKEQVFMSTETLQKDYPLLASSLLNLIKKSEDMIGK